MSGSAHKLGKWHKSICSKKLRGICQTLKEDYSVQSNDPEMSTESGDDGVLFKKVVFYFK